MEYSLYTFNKCSKLYNLTFTSFITKLNLIGFEIDEIFSEPLPTNSNIENIRVLIKIPSNREDLLNENFLKKELSTIFFIELLDLWSKLKQNYSFLIKQKYTQYYFYESVSINSNVENILMYTFEIHNLKYKKTPIWIKNKLLNSGIEFHNLFTDLLNLTTLELGQSITVLLEKNFQIEKNLPSFFVEQLEKPFHLEENISLEKGTIVLKNSKNQILQTLGILNQKKIENQNNLLLNCCFYDIHENVLNLNTINTKLSFRYLRKSYLETIKVAFQRLLSLIEILTTAHISLKKYYIQQKFQITPKKIISLRKNHLEKILGITKINFQIFQKANLQLLCQSNNELYFQIPNWRKDLNREIDLIEEYSRFVGYKNFKEIIPNKELKYYVKTDSIYELIKQFFLNFGFTEIITTSLEENISQERKSISLTNPLNSELSYLRSNLLKKIVEVFENNGKASNSFSNYFEIGRVFKNSTQKIIEQDKFVAVFQTMFFEKKNTNSLDWFKTKGFIESFFESFGFETLSFEKNSNSNLYYHPMRSVLIKYHKKIIGKFGEINPLITTINYKSPVYIFEINLQYLKYWKLKSFSKTYEEYSKYPVITKDLSFEIPISNSFSEIKKIIQQNIENLKNIEFFDIYFEEDIKNSVKVGIRLEFQSKTQTLITELIEKQIAKLKEILIVTFQATFRD